MADLELDTFKNFKSPVVPSYPFFSEEEFNKYTKILHELDKCDVVKLKTETIVPENTQCQNQRVANVRKPQVLAEKKDVRCWHVSSLSVQEQALYLRLWRVYKASNLSQPTDEEIIERRHFQELERRVQDENTKFQECLEKVAQENPKHYLFIEHPAISHTKEKSTACYQRVRSYPRFYKEHGEISLKVATATNVPLTLHSTVQQQGDIPRLQRPVDGKPCLKAVSQAISGRDRSRRNAPRKDCSMDQRLEDLAVTHDCKYVMSLTAFACLVNNSAPSFSNSWQLPVIIRQLVNPDGEVKRVIFIDKPLISKMTCRKKNEIFYKSALKLYMLTGGDEKKLSAYATNVSQTLPEVKAYDDRDKLFDDSDVTNVVDIETFGLSDYRASSRNCYKSSEGKGKSSDARKLSKMMDFKKDAREEREGEEVVEVSECEEVVEMSECEDGEIVDEGNCVDPMDVGLSNDEDSLIVAAGGIEIEGQEIDRRTESGEDLETVSLGIKSESLTTETDGVDLSGEVGRPESVRRSLRSAWKKSDSSMLSDAGAPGGRSHAVSEDGQMTAPLTRPRNAAAVRSETSVTTPATTKRRGRSRTSVSVTDCGRGEGDTRGGNDDTSGGTERQNKQDVSRDSHTNSDGRKKFKSETRINDIGALSSDRSLLPPSQRPRVSEDSGGSSDDDGLVIDIPSDADLYQVQTRSRSKVSLHESPKTHGDSDDQSFHSPKPSLAMANQNPSSSRRSSTRLNTKLSPLSIPPQLSTLTIPTSLTAFSSSPNLPPSCSPPELAASCSTPQSPDVADIIEESDVMTDTDVRVIPVIPLTGAYSDDNLGDTGDPSPVRSPPPRFNSRGRDPTEMTASVVYSGERSGSDDGISRKSGPGVHSNVETPEKHARGFPVGTTQRERKNTGGNSTNVESESTLDAIADSQTFPRPAGDHDLALATPHGADDDINKMYQVWTLGDRRMLLRFSQHGIVKDAMHKEMAVNVCQKLEYQTAFGLEQTTVSEAIYNWVASLVRGGATLLKARLDVFTGDILWLEETPSSHILPYRALRTELLHRTYNILDKLDSLEAGSYILSHKQGSDACSVKQAINENVRPTSVSDFYNLHASYQLFTHQEAPQTSPWVPLDPNLFLPHHWELGQIPATFQPFTHRNDKRKGKKNNSGAKRRGQYGKKK